MTSLDEIKSEFETITGIAKSTQISKEKVRSWLQSQDLEVLGAVHCLIMDKTIYLRIQPQLSIEDYHLFSMHYLGRCIRENPDGEWAESRYLAGGTLVNWFVHLWNDKAVPRHIVKELKDWLAKLYREGNEEIRTAIITATLEHLFEHKKIAKYFEDWRNDPILGSAYDEALGYAKKY